MAAEQLQFFGQEDPKDQSKKRKIISIPLDTLLLSGVVLVLLLVLFFSLGIEKGKKNALLAFENNRETTLKTKSMDTQAALARRVPTQPVPVQVTPVEAVTAQATPLIAVPVESAANQAISRAGKYSIQIASFQREAAASDEAKRLERKGFLITIQKKGKFSVVCIGAYDDYGQAQKQLDALKKIYKDCFIRRL
jgi:cell division septation protein DedD